MNWMKACVAVMGGSMVFGMSRANAQSQMVLPEADTFVSAAHSGRNYGASGAIAVSQTSAANGQISTLLRFNLASVKTSFDTSFGVGQWMPTSATITLSHAAVMPGVSALFSPPDSGTIDVRWLANDGWIEGTGTPNFNTSDGIVWTGMGSLLASGNQSAGSYNYTAATSGSGTYSLAIPSGFASDVTAGTKLTLLFDSTDANSLMFGIRPMFPNTDPFMTITAGPIPEPSALALLSFGVLALRRR